MRATPAARAPRPALPGGFLGPRPRPTRWGDCCCLAVAPQGWWGRGCPLKESGRRRPLSVGPHALTGRCRRSPRRVSGKDWELGPARCHRRGWEGGRLAVLGSLAGVPLPVGPRLERKGSPSPGGRPPWIRQEGPCSLFSSFLSAPPPHSTQFPGQGHKHLGCWGAGVPAAHLEIKRGVGSCNPQHGEGPVAPGPGRLLAGVGSAPAQWLQRPGGLRGGRWSPRHLPVRGNAHQTANGCFGKAAGRGTVTRRRGAIPTPVASGPGSSQQEGAEKGPVSGRRPGTCSRPAPPGGPAPGCVS